jgi:hypothetical protein
VNEGDNVVTTGASALRDGARVLVAGSGSGGAGSSQPPASLTGRPGTAEPKARAAR